jgi:2-polyprenyl-3-methyl-5-hydroxy-6-metoxy-1,4-benzoquinol methylase
MNKFTKNKVNKESEREKKEVNTKAYWDDRFVEDWEISQGPQQSRFFTRLAIGQLPSWLLMQIKRESLTIADWGCAQGDGTDVWASHVDAQQLVGVDFSTVAIEQASERYPAIRFINEDWLRVGADQVEMFDVVFSSNTLEHFHKPYNVLDTICRRARKAVILVLPYREFERIQEHFYSFLPENIPLVIQNGFRLVWTRVINCKNILNTMWPGDQVILVYADPKWMDTLGLTLNDVQIEYAERDALIISLNQAIAERDGQIGSLNQAVAERDALIISLNQAIAERDGQIAFVNSELKKIKQSTSWRITSPMRVAKNFIVAPRHTAYQIIRSLFWRLPANLRQGLHGPRHAFVRFVRGLPSPEAPRDFIATSDLSWEEFQNKVLSYRDQYKGIFIQEITIDWNAPLYSRPQHISIALGKLGYLVIYRTAPWACDNVHGFREIERNVWVTNRHEVDEIQGAIRSVYSTALAFSPGSVMKRESKQIWIYEYIDHIDPEISGDSENIRRLRELKKIAFSGGADYIVASARKLYEEAVNAVGKNKVILVPNGVDTAHYRDPIHQHTTLPSSLIEFRKKHNAVVGYFGALAPWLWYECIRELTAMRPEVGFVFIGPDYYGGSSKLPSSGNVLYLGAVDYKILPAYARQFDVCFIPFKPGDIARTTSPLKLFEYFALEKPIVVTADMDECTAYTEVFRGNSATELCNAIDKALQIKDSLSFKSRLRKLADQNDWSQRALAYEKILCVLLDEAAFTDMDPHEFTISDLVQRFRVSRAFVEQYKLNNQQLNWAAGSADAFFNGMSSLSRMHVEFAMSCVLRGIEMAKLIESSGLLQYKRRYLDVGTGYGGFPVAFANAGFEEVVGIELQDHLITYAKANTVNIPNVLILKRDIVEDPIGDLGSFDLITCNDVIEHVSDPSITIQKLASMLNYTGVISLEIPNKDCITWIVSDGHFQIFAITLLERSVAADYYAEVFANHSKENYLQEMGYSYSLEWYQEQLKNNGVQSKLLDTHKVCGFDDFPVQLQLLEERFQNFQGESATKLSPMVFENVKARVDDYLTQIKNEYESAMQLQDKERFVDKYLRTFWTLVGSKH